MDHCSFVIICFALLRSLLSVPFTKILGWTGTYQNIFIDHFDYYCHFPWTQIANFFFLGRNFTFYVTLWTRHFCFRSIYILLLLMLNNFFCFVLRGMNIWIDYMLCNAYRWNYSSDILPIHQGKWLTVNLVSSWINLVIIDITVLAKHPLREKCPNTELFLVRIFLYSVRIQENTARNNSVFGPFSRSGRFLRDFFIPFRCYIKRILVY